jgi:excisionase family DNA binding protein
MTNGCLTLAEAAQELGVHYMTVYRYVRTGRLPARQVGGEWQIEPADLARLRERAPGPARRAQAQGASAQGAPAQGAPAQGAPARAGLKLWQGQLEARLVAGDEPGSWALIEAVLAAGMKPDESLLELVAPAMRSIGTHWQGGELSIADEHRATAVSARLIARLGSRFGRRGVKRGTVVLAAPAGELHGLPVSIGANLLRWKGFNVVELGADTPPEALVEAVANEAGTDGRPLAVGIVSTLSGQQRSVERSVTEVRRAHPGVPVLLGGAAIADASEAHRLGADFYTGKRGDELVDALEAVAEQRH